MVDNVNRHYYSSLVLAERLSDLEDKYQMAVNFVLLEDGINRININDRRLLYLESLIESEFKATK